MWWHTAWKCQGRHAVQGPLIQFMHPVDHAWHDIISTREGRTPGEVSRGQRFRHHLLVVCPGCEAKVDELPRLRSVFVKVVHVEPRAAHLHVDNGRVTCAKAHASQNIDTRATGTRDHPVMHMCSCLLLASGHPPCAAVSHHRTSACPSTPPCSLSAPRGSGGRRQPSCVSSIARVHGHAPTCMYA